MENPADHDRVTVTVNYQPLGVLHVTRRHLRLDGLFVDTGGVPLPHHSRVEVTLSIMRNDRVQVHTLSALVMGRSRHGTNLTFQNCRRETYQALRELVAMR